MRAVAKNKGVDGVFEEGGRHIIVRFDGNKVTVLPRHNEINECTARGAIRDAEQWEKGRR